MDQMQSKQEILTEQRTPASSSQNEKSGKKYRILVSNYPRYATDGDLHRAFSKIGPVIVESMSRNLTAVLAYYNKCYADDAVKSQKIHVYGRFVKVKLLKETNENTSVQVMSHKIASPAASNESSRDSFKKYEDLNISGKNITEQINQLIKKITMPKEEIVKLSSVYDDIKLVLSKLWPECTLLPFGSITTGLFIISSDIDCFVKLPATYAFNNDLESVLDATKVLQDSQGLFSKVVCISDAHIPIVKCVHIRTGISCDITFKTSLGVRNTQVISFLLSFDPSLTTVAKIIKYWAKTNLNFVRLSSYALCLMLIFYFQQRPISILPPVIRLQQNPAYDEEIDNWNAGFFYNLEGWPKLSRRLSLPEMIGGFFKYYANFDFENIIVCPYLGCPVLKSHFFQSNLRPAGFDRYTSNVKNKYCDELKGKNICIQDPIQHCHNVASMIPSSKVSDILFNFKSAAEAFDHDKSNKWAFFLDKIFQKKPNTRIITYDADKNTVFAVQIKIDSEHIVSGIYKSVTKEVIHLVFEKVLKLKLIMKNNLDGNENEDTYTGTIHYPVWKRNRFNKMYSGINWDLESTETKITEACLSAYNNERDDIDFTLTVNYGSISGDVELILKSTVFPPKGGFVNFGYFFKDTVKYWLRTFLRQYLREASIS